MEYVNEQILATIPPEKWLPVSGGEDVQEQWLPLFVVTETNVTIGISRTGIWLAIGDKGSIRRLNAQSAVPLLVLLEKPLSEATELIGEGVQNSGLPEAMMQVVVSATLLTGLSAPMSYWQELSLKWLAEIESVDDVLLAALATVAKDGGTQKIRHTARRLHKGFSVT